MNNYAHLRFFLRKVTRNPFSILSREEYDELHGYELMQYRPENWEYFDKIQKARHANAELILQNVGFIEQVGKIAVLNDADFELRKLTVEDEPGFIRWIETKK